MEVTKQTAKKRTRKYNYFAFTLDDYATAAFVSWSKRYFGTLDDFSRLLTDDRNERFKASFEAFRQGDMDAKCYVAYADVQFAAPAKVLCECVSETGKGRYEHTNIYGFPYYMNFDRKVERRYLIKCGNQYYVAYRLQVENLTYDDEFNPNGVAQINSFWGFPSMIQNISADASKIIYENVLLECVGSFKSRQKANEVFMAENDLDYKEFFNDVFGDG